MAASIIVGRHVYHRTFNGRYEIIDFPTCKSGVARCRLIEEFDNRSNGGLGQSHQLTIGDETDYWPDAIFPLFSIGLKVTLKENIGYYTISPIYDIVIEYNWPEWTIERKGEMYAKFMAQEKNMDIWNGGKKVVPAVCTCDLISLMRYGCKCGQIERERQ